MVSLSKQFGINRLFKFALAVVGQNDDPCIGHAFVCHLMKEVNIAIVIEYGDWRDLLLNQLFIIGVDKHYRDQTRVDSHQLNLELLKCIKRLFGEGFCKAVVNVYLFEGF